MSVKEFTLLGFISHLSTLGLQVEHANHSALEHCGRVVQREAKSAIGTYRYGWPALAASTVARKKNGDTPLLETGEMRDSINYTVTHKVGAVGNAQVQIGSDNQKAVWHEKGTSRFPPRPFLEGALKAKTPEVLEIIGRAVHGKLSGTDR
jgi:HK97 gp10 family phage protein